MLIFEIIHPAPVQRMLIVVHPGSACGSAEFNLGKYQGRAAREALAHDIAAWNGPLLVVDSELSDEIPGEQQLHGAIEGALARNRSAGHLVGRVMGDPMAQPRWVSRVTAFVRNFNRSEWLMELTGAWADDRDGCVAHVYNALSRNGFRCDIRDSAIYLDR